MFAHGAVHYYVNELTSLRSGKLIIPIMWFKRDGVMHVQALEVVEMDVSSVAMIFLYQTGSNFSKFTGRPKVLDKLIVVPAKDLDLTYEELKAERHGNITFHRRFTSFTLKSFHNSLFHILSGFFVVQCTNAKPTA